MSRPALGDHVWLDGEDHPAGRYRVVGTDGHLALLQVGDADGRRVHTGRVVRLPAAAVADRPAAQPPTCNRSAISLASGGHDHAYWSVRAFVGELAARPRAAGAGVTLVLAGTVGDAILPLPDVAAGLAIVVGSPGLAFVGGGRRYRSAPLPAVAARSDRGVRSRRPRDSRVGVLSARRGSGR